MKSSDIKSGDRFGRLVVIKYDHTNRFKYYLCVCDCGNTKVVRSSHLVDGDVKSCGCIRSERAVRLFRKHGYRLHPVYHYLVEVWNGIKKRCYCKNAKSYENYGGRGIVVCDEWRNSCKLFCDWAIKNGWKRGLQIDRINNDEGYCPSNCRIVTVSENLKNRRPYKVKNRNQ